MMMCGGWGDKERLKKHRKRKMEGLRRNVRGKEGREGEPIALRLRQREKE